MRLYLPAACWALAMLMLAVLARFGLVDRGAAATLLLVMPILAFVSIQRDRRCALSSRSA